MYSGRLNMNGLFVASTHPQPPLYFVKRGLISPNYFLVFLLPSAPDTPDTPDTAVRIFYSVRIFNSVRLVQTVVSGVSWNLPREAGLNFRLKLRSVTT